MVLIFIQGESKIKTNNLLKNIFKNPNKDFINYNNHWYTYEDFLKISLNTKQELLSKGLKAEDTIILILNNSIELLFLYFACILTNIVVIPIDPLKSELEINEIISNCKYNQIISDRKINQKHLTLCDFSFKKAEDINHNFLDLNLDNLFLISFTSGSTGKPKGVMHSFNNLLNSALAFKEKFKFNEKNIFYHNLPMTYMAGILNQFVLPLISGSKIVIGPRFSITNALNFWQIPIMYQVNTFWIIPAIVSILLKLDRSSQGINYIKNNHITFCIGTAPLPKSHRIQFFIKYSSYLYESYGQSETLFVSTNHPDLNQNSPNVGEPLDGVSLESKDNEILISVPWMFLGYYNNNSKDNFTNNKFKSGDLGIFKNNLLTINGRIKDLIIKGGINISPKKIKETINPYFEEIEILGMPDSNSGERIVGFYIGRTDTKEVNKILKERLGSLYTIDEFISIKEIPKNTNGKVNKIKIKEFYNDYKN